MHNEEFRRGFHFAYGDGPSSKPPIDEPSDVRLVRWRKREINFPNENWDDEVLECNSPFIKGPVILSNERKHHILDEHWEPNTWDTFPTLQHTRESVLDPELITEDPGREKGKGYHLWKLDNLSPPPSDYPYKVAVKVVPCRGKNYVSTALATRQIPPKDVVWRKGEE